MSIDRGRLLLVPTLAATLLLAACGGDDKPKTPDLSAEIVAKVDAGDCLDLDDRLGQAQEALDDAFKYNDGWGEQYRSLVLWKGRQLGCDWAG